MISERETTYDQDPTDPQHPPHVPHPTPTQQQPFDPQFTCYHPGCHFNTDDERSYRAHGALKHFENPLLFPCKAEIEKFGLQHRERAGSE